MTKLTEEALAKKKKDDIIKITLGLQAENEALQQRIAELEKPSTKKKAPGKKATTAPLYG